MFERLYLWLLRLYPSAFRAEFGEAANQLVRDRLRDERRPLSRLRLYRDLLLDLAMSLPREFRYAEPSLAGAPSRPIQAGPMFAVLEGKPPTPTSMALAGLVSLGFFAGVAYLIGHGGGHLVLRSWDMHPERQLRGPGFGAEHAPPQPGAGGDTAAFESGAAKASSGATPPGANASAADQPWQRAAFSATPAAEGETALVAMDSAYTRWVVSSVAADLRQHYFNPAIGGRLAESMQVRAAGGAYDAVPSDSTLAQFLTRQLRASTGDLHLEVVYSPAVLPHPVAAPSADDMARYRQAMADSHCTLEGVETIQHNIGYLRLDSFPDPAVCGAQLAEAISSLNHTSALIIDLRDNRGGVGSAVMLVSNYLFDHPQFIFSPREAAGPQLWTKPVAGNMLADKPVFVLTSHATISAAEQFTYNLKMLKRATIVGETTAGAAHAGVFHRLDDHFGVAIPQVKTVNPYGKPDWEVVGIEPDVQAPAVDALRVAANLAAEKLRNR